MSLQKLESDPWDQFLGVWLTFCMVSKSMASLNQVVGLQSLQLSYLMRHKSMKIGKGFYGDWRVGYCLILKKLSWKCWKLLHVENTPQTHFDMLATCWKSLKCTKRYSKKFTSENTYIFFVSTMCSSNYKELKNDFFSLGHPLVHSLYIYSHKTDIAIITFFKSLQYFGLSSTCWQHVFQVYNEADLIEQTWSLE